MARATDTVPVALNYEDAARDSGYSTDVIRRAVRAGDLPAHYPEVDGRQLSKPVILRDDLHAWIARGRTERIAS